MKIRILSVAVLLTTSVIAVFGISIQKASFKVSGKCGMCETRIEKAALSVKGVESAQWDKETGIMEVDYDATKADPDKIQKAIATVGHDTEHYAASDNVFEKLPDCCKYERMKVKAAVCYPGSSSSPCCPSIASCPSAK
ncbi:MAG: heavy-metal-associated domain-containing protein [Bacteroidales bacterium]